MKINIISYLKRMLGYSAASILGTIVDTVVLWIFSHLIFESYVGRVVISPVISFECAVFVNFLSAYNLIWKNRISAPGLRSFLRHYIAYNLSNTGIFIIKLGILMVLEKLLLWDVVICNLLALCITGILNFSLNEFVIFRRKKDLPTLEEIENGMAGEGGDLTAATSESTSAESTSPSE